MKTVEMLSREELSIERTREELFVQWLKEELTIERMHSHLGLSVHSLCILSFFFCSYFNFFFNSFSSSFDILDKQKLY